MGKFIDRKGFMERIRLDKVLGKKEKFIFKVKFRSGKNIHTEYFEVSDYEEADRAVDMGLVKFKESGYADYLDWKPIGGPYYKTLAGKIKQVEGGIKEVDKFYYDEKYIYAYVEIEDKTYALPAYLSSKIKSDKYIFFGRRLLDKEVKEKNTRTL